MSVKLLIGTSSTHFHEAHYDAAEASLKLTSSTEAPQPGWLHLDGDALYAVSEAEEGLGKVVKFNRVESEWQRSWLSECSSEGTCHCSIAESETDSKMFLLAANYVGHTVDAFDEKGKLLRSVQFLGSGPFEGRQESSHCHQVIQDLRKRFVYVNDLGGDVLHRYRLQFDGSLSAAGRLGFKPAQGPRHCAFNPSLPDLIYVICELSNEITVIQWAKSGDPEILQTISVLPDSSMEGEKHKEYPQPASAGEIQITKDGKFLYASTRYLPKYKSDTILYAPLDRKGRIGEVTHVNTGLISPWHFSLSPDEKFLAVAFKDSSVVRLYGRDQSSGALKDLCSLTSGIENPSCVIFL